MKKEVVVKKDMTNTDGLAVDWIYNHIYWTNADNNTVEVSNKHYYTCLEYVVKHFFLSDSFSKVLSRF